jgi:hypothetical protein
MRRTCVGAVFLALLQTNVTAAESNRPVGPNCSSNVPPVDAGEEINHGVTLKVFPRALNIGPSYTGCQVMVAPYPSGWEVLLIAEIVQGEAVRVWSADGTSVDVSACRYQQNELVSGPSQCPKSRFLLVRRSLPPGCVERIRAAVAANAARPAECLYE